MSTDCQPALRVQRPPSCPCCTSLHTVHMVVSHQAQALWLLTKTAGWGASSMDHQRINKHLLTSLKNILRYLSIQASKGMTVQLVTLVSPVS